MRVFVTRQLPGNALDRLAARHTVAMWPGALPPSPAELATGAADADALLTLLTDRVDADLLDACPRVRAVSNYAVGFENVDLATATARGIPVGHTPGVLTEATAQLAITLMLDLLRRVTESDRYVRHGRWRTWEPAGHLGATLEETTIGLVGYGRIGQEVGRLARALGMRVIHTDPIGGGDTLETVLADSDVVSLHAVLTPQTRGLIDAPALASMRAGAILINVSRGPMVDSAALVDALRSGRLAGAGLDVTDPEPLPVDHELLTMDNVIVTPHIASATVTARTAMAQLAVDNLLAALDRHPMPHCANPEVYARSHGAR
jgi:glyoxylate reductase